MREKAPDGMTLPQLAFASPRLLPKAEKLVGRVVVRRYRVRRDGRDVSVSFERITAPFIAALGDRLAAWVDHHDHERHPDFAGDPRFVLATKARARGVSRRWSRPSSCARPARSIVSSTHVDLDGLVCSGEVDPRRRGARRGRRACRCSRSGRPGGPARRRPSPGTRRARPWSRARTACRRRTRRGARGRGGRPTPQAGRRARRGTAW